MTEVQKVALQIMISKKGFHTRDEDTLNDNIINSTTEAMQFLELSSAIECGDYE